MLALLGFFIAQNTVAFLICKHTLTAEVEFFSYPYTQILSSGLLSMHSSCIDSGGCPDPGAGPCTLPC